MKTWRKAIAAIRNQLHHARIHISHPDALLSLAVLGLITGIVTGSVIVIFRYAVDGLRVLLIPDGQIGHFEALSVEMRLLLPLAGALLIALVFRLIGGKQRVVGVVHVLERLEYHQGRMTFRSLILQFIGAVTAIASGQSVGREGPGIHLGAASGSLLAQGIGAPNNVVRTLLGCGTAGAIGASFNTPLAGVIFSLEVIMLEYTVSGFIPVVLSAVGATVVSVAFFGVDPAFAVPELQWTSLWEMPFAILVGITVGLASTLLIASTKTLAERSQRFPFTLRVVMAGALTGIVAVFYPQVMGIGYDTIAQTLAGTIGAGLLVGIALSKIVTTSAAIGLGIPGGIIGPTLVIGAVLGGAMGILGHGIFPTVSSDSGHYAILGMGAMMGATLQAPLAALVAVFELTQNPHIIMPGMLAIVVAGLISGRMFGYRSVFRVLLRARGLDYIHDPVVQAMRRVGVASEMERSFVTTDGVLTREDAATLLEKNPRWVVVTREKQPVSALPALDVERALQSTTDPELDLLEVPAKRLSLTGIHMSATVDQALERLSTAGADALFLYNANIPALSRVQGIVTREALQASYRY